jgi:hypothetical protein
MSKDKLMESVLVIILNETRAYEHTFDLFKTNLLDVFQADLCLCIADNDREDKNNPFYQHAKYVWQYEEPEDWGDAFDHAQKIKGYDGNWRKLLEVKDQWLGGVKGEGEHPGSAGIGLFFRWFLKESIINHNVLDKYDRFVVTRSDFVHKIPHVPMKYLHPDHIWIPYGEDYGGYTDRHIISHRRDIINILSITDAIISDSDKLYSKMNFFSYWNLEKYLKFSFSCMGLTLKVKRFPYTMYSVRSIDGHTSWKKGNYNEELGYYIKYPREYQRFQIAATIIRKVDDWNKFKIFLLNATVADWATSSTRTNCLKKYVIRALPPTIKSRLMQLISNRASRQLRARESLHSIL